MESSIPKTKKVRVINSKKSKNKAIKKQRATNRLSATYKKIKDAKDKRAVKEAKRADLKQRAVKAKTKKEKSELNKEL